MGLAIYHRATNQVRTVIRDDYGGYRPPDGWELVPVEQLPAGWTRYDPRDLDVERAAKITAIDARSAALIVAGLPMSDGSRISTSLPASQNLQDLLLGMLAGETMFPQGVSTLDGGEYVIRDVQQLLALVQAFRAWKLGILDAGRALRLRAIAAITIQELDGVVDERCELTEPLHLDVEVEEQL